MINNKRLNHIDLLECIAILFVLIYHSPIYTFVFTAKPSFLTYLSYYLRGIVSTCVPIFFFANGYLLLNRPFHLKKHILKMIRIISLLLIWSVISVSIHILVSGTPLTARALVFGILYMDAAWGMNFYWFLGALICIYVFFPALKALFDSDKLVFTVFTIICAALTFGFVLANQLLAVMEVIFHRWFGTVNYPLFEMFNPFRELHGYSFVYFCTGGLVCAYEDRIYAISRRIRNITASAGLVISCGLLFLLGLFYTHCSDGEIWDIVWNGYDTIFTFCNVIFIYILSLNYTGNLRFIRIVSHNTLGIYFMHPILLLLTRALISSADYLRSIPGHLLYSFIILCICLGCCVVMKKIPVLKKLL